MLVDGDVAIVLLPPELRAGIGVNQVHGHANLRTCLPNAPFQHVAGAELLAHRPDIGRLSGELGRGLTGNDPQMGKSRQSARDVLGETRGQRRQVRIRAPMRERQHRDPQPGTSGLRPNRTIPVGLGAADGAGDETGRSRSPAAAP